MQVSLTGCVHDQEPFTFSNLASIDMTDDHPQSHGLPLVCVAASDKNLLNNTI